MARTLRSDKPLFLVTILLVGVGLVMVYSASFVMAVDRFDNPYYFLLRQGVWAVLGLGAMYAVMQIDYRRYNRPPAIWAMVIGVAILLVLVLLFGPVINGTRRWFVIGPLSFQPSELAKLGAVFFTAAVLDRRMHRIHDLASVVPIGLVTFIFVALVIWEPDYGTSGVIIGVALAMLFAAGLPYRHLVALGVPLAGAAALLVAVAPYRLARVMSYLDPWADASGSGYQVVQSLIAIGSGGVVGRGLMEGQQKIYYLPEAHTDFIFSVVGEEFGLLGATALLVAFAVLAWRGFRIALRAPDRFGTLVAIGITTIIAGQALINIGVVTGLLPPKGLALPFVSNGGSSLLANLVGMGVLLNVSQHASSGARHPARASDWSLSRQGA